MKNELHLIQNTLGLTLLLFLSSCRSTDTENILTGGGHSAVNINLLGTEYADKSALAKGNILNSGNMIQRHNTLLTPSSVITAELSSLTDAPAGLARTSMAELNNKALSPGMRFRVIAYRTNGAYHTHQDYTVGQAAVPMMLDNSAAYNIVVYSYGTSTLPDISSGEKSNLNSAQVSYDNTNRDFMYQKVPFTPTDVMNTLNITLRHKVALITVTMNSGHLGEIEDITEGLLKPHYSNGIYPLASGVMTAGSRTAVTTGVPLTFTGLNTAAPTSDPVFINANAKGSFSAKIKMAGSYKTISLTNAFNITPEYKSNLTINLKKCGAYLGPGNTLWKEFMCHNLGADINADPFTPSAAIHGAKYQWGANTGEIGRYYSQSDDQRNSDEIAGWNRVSKPVGSWSDTSKTENDPCPDGYRVPTKAQWQAVIDNNKNTESVGTWSNNGNYTSALYFRTSSGVRTLMLPSPGSRDTYNGLSRYRGSRGFYWSSSGSTYDISFSDLDNYNLTFGFSIRCIAE